MALATPVQMQQTHFRPAPHPAGQPSQPPHYPASYVGGPPAPRQPGPPPGHHQRYGAPHQGYHQSPGQPMIVRPGGPPAGHLTQERQAQQQYMVASLRSAGAPVGDNMVTSGGPPPGTYYARPPPGPGAVGQGRPGMAAPGGRMIHPGAQLGQQPSMHTYGPPSTNAVAQSQQGGPPAQTYQQYMHPQQPLHPSQQGQHPAAPPTITTSSPHPRPRPVHDQHSQPPTPIHNMQQQYPATFAPQQYQAQSPASTPQLIHPNAAQSPLRQPDPPMRVLNGNLSVGGHQEMQTRMRVATTPQQARPPPSLPPPPPQQPLQAAVQNAPSQAPPRVMNPPAQMVQRVAPPQMPKTEPPHGSAILRLLQFFAGLADGETRGQLSYWQNHIQTYYTENGSLMYALKSANDDSKKFFELSCASLPRYFLTGYQCGLRSIALNLENPRESRAPYSIQQGTRTITVDVSRASMTNVYTNDSQVVFRGALKCVMIFTPNDLSEGGGPPSGGGSLLIDRMEFNTLSFVEFIARTSVKCTPVYRMTSSGPKGESGHGGSTVTGANGKMVSTPAGQAPTPGMTPNSTGAVHSTLPSTKTLEKGKARETAISEVDESMVDDDDDDGAAGARAADESAEIVPSGLTGAEDEGSLTSAHQQAFEIVGETVTMPDQCINEFGVSNGALRCLEIAQTVGQMGPLLAYCQTASVTPKDGLRQFADHQRARANASANGSQTAPQTPGQTGSLAMSGSSPHPPTAQAPTSNDSQSGVSLSGLDSSGLAHDMLPSSGGDAVQSSDKAARSSLKRKKSNVDESDARSSTTPDSSRPPGPMTRRRSRITLNGDPS